MASDVEVLIVSYGSADPLERCLASVAAFVPGAAIAVREHSAQVDAVAAVERVIARSGLPIRFVHDPSNPGFGAGCNALAATSIAGWLLFLNPDAELVTWPWADTSPPREAIVGPRFVGDAGGRHHGRRYRVRDEIARSWLRRRGHAPAGRGFVSGAALLVDAGSFRRIGGFDPGYFLFYEDIDLCLRANAVGIATRVEPAWTVRHHGGHSTTSRYGAALQWSYASACRFHARHSGGARGYRIYVVADSLARAMFHVVARRPARGRAYLALARRAATDAVRPEPAPA